MFFARCVVFCLSFLLKNQKRPVHRYLLLLFDYNECKRKVIAWHKAKLEDFDPLYRTQQAGLRLVAAREKAHSEGIGPLDPRYPDIEDFMPIDWDEETRVHGDILAAYRKTGDLRMQRLAEAVEEYPQERVDAVTQACVSALKPEQRKQ